MCSVEKSGPAKATIEQRGVRATVRRWLGRAGWLAVIWLGSVAVLGVAAWLLRLLMQAIGMSPA